jgi:hypothetical protein
LVDRCFGGVEILRLSLSEETTAKGDRAPLRVLNRKDQTTSETVVEAGGPLLQADEAARLDLGTRRPLGPQVPPKGIPAIGRIAEAKGLSGRVRHPPLNEIVLGAAPFRIVEETIFKELERPLIELKELRALAIEGLVEVRFLGDGNRQTDLAGDRLDRLGKRGAFQLHNEGEDIPRLAAAKTFEELLAGADREAGSLLLVKRAAAPVVGPLLAEGQVVGDDPHDVGLLTNLFAEPTRNAHDTHALLSQFNDRCALSPFG